MVDMKKVKELVEELRDRGRNEAYGSHGGGRHPIRPDSTWLLTGLVYSSGAMNLVELGTAYGYSALFLLLGKREEAKLWTVEFDKNAAYAARDYLYQAGFDEDDVDVIRDDATEFLKGWKNGSIDFLFLDAEKSLYGKWYLLARKHLRPGSLIVADNVLRKGADIDCQDEVKDFVFAVQQDCPDMKILETECGLLVAHYEGVQKPIAIEFPLDQRIAVD